MARHTKGKHAAKKAGISREARRAASPEKNESTPGAHDADEASAASEERAEASVATVAEEERAPEAPASEVASTEEGAAAKEDAHGTAEPSADAERTEKMPKNQIDLGRAKKKPSRGIAKRLGMAAAIIVGVLGVGYLGGVALFATHFFPNTNIATVDISWDAPEQAAAELDETVGSFSFKVKGQGMNLTVTSSQAGMALDAQAVADAVLERQSAWEWPLRVFDEHDMTEAVADAMSASTLSDIIEQAVAEVNATAEAPVDASVIFKDEIGKFYIAPEVEGTMLDPQKVVDKCMEGVLTLKKDVILKKEERLDPAVLEDDQRLVDACAQANQLARADITFTLDGTPAANVNATTIGAWVTVTPEFEVLFNQDELTLWAEGIGEQFNTVGTTRTYTRPDGKEVTVSGGPYGWKVDGEALEAAAIEAVQNGTIGNIEIPVLQSGRGFTALGSQDWGARYVDVDLSEQHARFYGSDGSLLWESDIVSGAKGKTDSPTGVYSLNHKQSPTVLIGEMTSDGTPEYESKVTYWMPFKGNSVGLHDASWQSAFGGNRYATGYGSHGCINLPIGAAGELYGMIEPGDVVVVHY